MFTRFYDDPCRIVKQNQLTTEHGRYMLDVPGNGEKPFYMEDPQIIPQKWAGNLWTHSVDIQSSLMGLDKTMNRDCLNTTGSLCNRPEKPEIIARPIIYPTSRALTTDQPRATDPAWTARDLDQSYRTPLMENFQANTRIFQSFDYDNSTRLAEKDGFVRQTFCVPTDTNFYGLPSESITNPTGHSNFTASNRRI